MKRFVLVLLMLFSMTLAVQASDGCFINENCTWWATIGSGSGFYDADSANLTIIDPDGLVVFSDEVMTNVQIGTFIYTYKHNKTGNYLGYTEFIESGAVISTASQSLQVKIKEIGAPGKVENMNNIAMILGVGVFCAVLLIIAFSLDKQHAIWKLFTVLFVIFTLGIVVKASVDGYQNCNVLLTNTSTDANGNLVYNYAEQCVGSELSTGKMFLNSNRILLSSLSVYILVFLLYIVTDQFTKIGDSLKRTFNKRR